MLYRNHYIELWINGQLAELESQESLNLRIDNVLFEPVKAVTKQIEYSYSFSLPATPQNNKIFDYANILAKPNKFHMRYSAKVYADGELIFDGSLTVRRFADKKYECNLVNIKVNSLDDIFGSAKLTDIPWMVDYSGATTINTVNEDMSTKYYFPFVSYGVFQKVPYHTDDVASDYTSKFVMDKWNRYWNETFYPSLNMMEHVKRAFEWKGYDVLGTAYTDETLTNIFESCNLADEQMPDYNLGNPLFGRISLKTQFSNSGNTDNGMWEQELNYPYYAVSGNDGGSGRSMRTEYNFSTVNMWNMCDSVNNPNATVTLNDKTYMYDPDEQVIVIPKSGFYKIRMKANAMLNGVGDTFNASQWTTSWNEQQELGERSISLTKGFKDNTPLEIQLIRNYDSNVELIKGRKNVRYKTGNPNDTVYTYRTGSTQTTFVNKVEWDTEFPHQYNYRADYPTKSDGLTVSATENEALKEVEAEDNTRGGRGSSRTVPSRRTSRGDGNTSVDATRRKNLGSANVNGYMHRNGQLMPYDQCVSEAFICGFSTMGDGTISVMRNGYSWSRTSSRKNAVFAAVQGLDLVYPDGTTSATTYCQNAYNNSANYGTFTDSSMAGEIQCCVWLEKNDVVEIVAIQRDYSGKRYTVNATVELDITAMTDRPYEQLVNDAAWGYNSNTEFPEQLNLSNFTNNDKTIVDYIEGVATAFNLDIVQNGNEIQINLNENPITSVVNNVVDIDDRINASEIETETIEYPRKMSVQYRIDTEEYGYETTVPQEWINTEEWAKHGDSGFSIIDLSDDTYVTTDSTTIVDYSYTYYTDFMWNEVVWDATSGYTQTGSQQSINIPVLGKSEYMADGYGYEEAMKHDGYGLTQRLWFREAPNQEYVVLADSNHEKVWLSYPTNIRHSNGFNLSYKNTERSILTDYFQMMPLLSSNYVIVEVYLNPSEYKALKGFARVHLDSDLYMIAEIGAYDATNHNKTQLKLVKIV